jgi:hypothetical protein
MKKRKATVVLLQTDISLEQLDLFAQKIQARPIKRTGHARSGLPLWQNRDKVRFVSGVEAYPVDL